MPVIPALWETKAGGSPEVGSSRPAWPTWRNPVSPKDTKLSQAWWCVPVIPATQEAEAGKSLEPRRWRLRWAKISPLHPSLGNKSEIPSQKKKKYSWDNQRNVNAAWILDDTKESLIIVKLLIEMRFHRIVQVGLRLLGSRDRPTSAFQSAGNAVWATMPCPFWSSLEKEDHCNLLALPGHHVGISHTFILINSEFLRITQCNVSCSKSQWAHL